MGLLSVALTLAKTARDALFFQDQGLFQLPMAYMGISMASMPAAFLFVWAMKAWGARLARVGILIFTAAVLAAFVPFLEPGNYPVLASLFIFIPTVFGIIFASIWLLAFNLFEDAPKMVAARSFSRIAASAMAGGIVGGLLSKTLALHLEPEWLVLLASSVILMAVGAVVKTHRRFSRGMMTTVLQRESASLSSAFSKKYARNLLLISVTGALAGLFIDFQFYASASSTGMDSKSSTNFFANFYIILNLGSLVLQLFAAPKIQDKVGLRGGLMILPLALVGGATFVTAAGTALSRSALRVTEGGLKSSIYRSLWEQAFIPVKSDERSYVRVLVEGFGARIAEGIGAILLLLWLMRADTADPSSLNTTWIAWVILLTAAGWLFLIRILPERVKQEPSFVTPDLASIRPIELEGVRVPDQCPCTTEWGKGIT